MAIVGDEQARNVWMLVCIPRLAVIVRVAQNFYEFTRIFGDFLNVSILFFDISCETVLLKQFHYYNLMQLSTHDREQEVFCFGYERQRVGGVYLELLTFVRM
jgi:hypothetical protein